MVARRGADASRRKLAGGMCATEGDESGGHGASRAKERTDGVRRVAQGGEPVGKPDASARRDHHHGRERLLMLHLHVWML